MSSDSHVIKQTQKRMSSTYLFYYTKSKKKRNALVLLFLKCVHDSLSDLTNNSFLTLNQRRLLFAGFTAAKLQKSLCSLEKDSEFGMYNSYDE